VSRDSQDRRDGSGRPGPDEPAGRLRTTGPGALVGFALIGLVIGWAVRPVSTAMHRAAPTVTWLPGLVLLFVAVVIGSVAWSTWRLHRRRERLEPHRAVNRLVLGKACALAGSLVAGGYLGYALSWVGVADAVLARGRIVHSVFAGATGVLLVVGSLLLERACRVAEDDR
jgi:hypothetical protein